MRLRRGQATQAFGPMSSGVAASQSVKHPRLPQPDEDASLAATVANAVSADT